MNALYTPNELQVGIDVGSLNHSVAISDGNGNIYLGVLKFKRKSFDGVGTSVPFYETEVASPYAI